VFGRLPVLHQLLVIAIGLAAGALAGVWVATFDVRVAVPLAAIVGGTTGLVAAYAVVHDFHHHPRRRPVRVRRH